MTTRATIDGPWAEPVNLGPIVNSKAYFGWILHLLGNCREAEREFHQADKLQRKIDPDGYRLYSIYGVLFADFIISMKRIDEAFELVKTES